MKEMYLPSNEKAQNHRQCEEDLSEVTKLLDSSIQVTTKQINLQVKQTVWTWTSKEHGKTIFT